MVLPKLFERMGLIGGRRADVSSVEPLGVWSAADRPASVSANQDAAVMSEVEGAIEQGDLIRAVDLLASVDRRRTSSELEVMLVDLRHAAAALVVPRERAPWPPTYADPFVGLVGQLPVVEAREFDVEVLGGAVQHHGCLVVRGLFNEDQISSTIHAIRSAEEQRVAPVSESSTDRWYRPFPKASKFDQSLRQMVARSGGTWLADSPASCALILEHLAAAGAIDAIAAHFGDRPLFSLQKSTLRHSEPIYNFAGWHQDGSFLGPEVRAMNVWVALTACGGDLRTPGIELVPKRIDKILPTDGGLGPASISDASILRAAGDTPPIHPEFAPGDAMLFDERFLHRTHLTTDMEVDRYALECWLFAPGHSLDKYLSFLV